MKTKYIVANSYNRNVVQDKLTNQYSIYFQNITGVKSIQAINVTIPNTASVTAQPGLLLVLDGYNVMEDAYNETGISYVTWMDTIGTYIKAESSDIRKTFDPPLARLSKLRVSFRTFAGALATFGQATNPDGSAVTPLDPAYQSVVIFRIEYDDKLETIV